MTTAYHARAPVETIAIVGTSERGLESHEARARLETEGPNALRAAPPRSAWSILLDQLRSVVAALLIASIVVSAMAGDPVDAAAIGAVLALNVLLGFVMELRARRAMHALLRLDAPRATVIRDGAARGVDAREIVRGDLVIVEAGQAVPADARVVMAVDAMADEAPLTGESSPVHKGIESVPAEAPLAERASMLYKGTMLVTGSARAIVVGTGMNTEVGRSGELLERIPDERTILERRLDALGTRLVWIALIVGAIVIGLGAAQGLPLAHLLQSGIALAIAAVPEGLPIVATIALAIGVRRMARRNALVRRLPAVESLGSVTVVCTDKTGTLTAGRMAVTTLWLDGIRVDVSGDALSPSGDFAANGDPVSPDVLRILDVALRVGTLANRATLSRSESAGWQLHGDPTDGALLVAARKRGIEPHRLGREWPELGELPFSSERMIMASFNRAPDSSIVAHVKGAPDRVLLLCARVMGVDGARAMTAADRARIERENETLARNGLRVLALATGPGARAEAHALGDLTFVALVGMIDPPAEGVRETIATIRKAGIRTVMLTGDQALTAEAIARDLGIISGEPTVLEGAVLSRLEPRDRDARILRAEAFSRVSPEDKLTIVTAHQRAGAIVAMLGDGVNDAAALKKADVGVAMGLRGTDIAKDAATIVLRDDRFSTIAAAIEEGRVIFDNIRKFVFYLFSCNLGEILVLLGAAGLGLPMPLLPLQILWLNLLTDTFPALALAAEPSEPDVMDRPPRDPNAALLSSSFLWTVLLFAVLIAVPALVAFGVGLRGGSGRATTMCFLTLAFAQVFHLGNARQRGHVLSGAHASSNVFAIAAVLLVVLLQIASVHVSPLARLLHTVPIGIADWITVIALGSLPAVLGQSMKVARGRPRAAA